MRRSDSHDEVSDYLIKHFWVTLDEPWEPGFYIDYRGRGRRLDIERMVRIYIPGPTWLDKMILDLDEAVTIARRFLDSEERAG